MVSMVWSCVCVCVCVCVGDGRIMMGLGEVTGL